MNRAVMMLVVTFVLHSPPPPPSVMSAWSYKILGAFEANAFSEHDLRLAREKWAASSSASSDAAGLSPSTAVSPVSIMTKAKGYKRKREAGGTDAMDLQEIEGGKEAGEGSGDGGYFGLKYLTSSRLLRLQLRDPTLRLQVRQIRATMFTRMKRRLSVVRASPGAYELPRRLLDERTGRKQMERAGQQIGSPTQA